MTDDSRPLLHAWRAYERFAWGEDELEPLTQTGNNGGYRMALTMVDSLDTLLILGLDTWALRPPRDPSVFRGMRRRLLNTPQLARHIDWANPVTVGWCRLKDCFSQQQLETALCGMAAPLMADLVPRPRSAAELAKLLVRKATRGAVERSRRSFCSPARCLRFCPNTYAELKLNIDKVDLAMMPPTVKVRERARPPS